MVPKASTVDESTTETPIPSESIVKPFWDDLLETANAVPDMHGRARLVELVNEGYKHNVKREIRLSDLAGRLESALGDGGMVEKTLYEQTVQNAAKVLEQRNQIAAAFSQVYNVCNRLKGHVTSHAGRMLLHLVLSTYKIEVQGNGVPIPRRAERDQLPKKATPR